jgi:hypothetical protein
MICERFVCIHKLRVSISIGLTRKVHSACLGFALRFDAFFDKTKLASGASKSCFGKRKTCFCSSFLDTPTAVRAARSIVTLRAPCGCRVLRAGTPWCTRRCAPARCAPAHVRGVARRHMYVALCAGTLRAGTCRALRAGTPMAETAVCEGQSLAGM